MNKSNEKIEGTNETLNKLIDLITTTVVATEKRAVKTDDKIDKLTESMTLSNIANAEARKDNRDIFKTLERHDQNQKEQGVKLTTGGPGGKGGKRGKKDHSEDEKSSIRPPGYGLSPRGDPRSLETDKGPPVPGGPF